MGRAHHHHHHAQGHGARLQGRRRLAIVLGLTIFYMFAELAGGVWTGSLALIADAGHMLADAAALALALLAITLAERPATVEKTYGYYRVEILATVINAAILLGIALYVCLEAYDRFRNPPAVQSRAMVAVAIIGLLVNGAGLWLLHEGSRHSLNMKGAYFEVLADAVTSLGVIAGGVTMWATGWYYADPIISAGIAIFILPRTWHLMREAVDILLEGVPAGVDISSLRKDLVGLDGVAGIHDLHVWSLTSGVNAMSVHVVLEDGARHDEVLCRCRDHIVGHFGIGHATVQVEPPGLDERELHL